MERVHRQREVEPAGRAGPRLGDLLLAAFHQQRVRRPDTGDEPAEGTGE